MRVVDFDQMTSEQQRAVTTLDRSITLTAGAGTGKTTTLTKRYLPEGELQKYEDTLGEFLVDDGA